MMIVGILVGIVIGYLAGAHTSDKAYVKGLNHGRQVAERRASYRAGKVIGDD